MIRIVVACFTLALIPTLSLGSTIEVPSQQPTIQDAIDIALDGDVILVAPGVFTQNIDFLGKAVEVRSAQGPAVTTLQADPAGVVVSFVNGEGPASVLDGFTIINPNGSGVSCVDSSPTIRGNVITIFGSGSVAGVTCDGGSATIDGNILDSCEVTLFGGGILCTNGASPMIVGNRISNCVAYAYGGAIASLSAAPTLLNNVIDWNSLYLSDSDTTLTHNTLVGATVWGVEGSTVVTNSILFNSTLLATTPTTEMDISYSNYCLGGAGNYCGEPLLEDWPNGDYRISSNSPVIDLGTPFAPSLPDLDLVGEPRNQGEAPDMGAYETPFAPGIGNLDFIRGDADGNGQFEALPDAYFLLVFDFVPGSPYPPCLDAADADGNGIVCGIVDGLRILNYGYVAGSPGIPPPFPTCGPDPESNALGCVEYSPCP